MSESETATATIRWFLLSLATAATVAAFYLLASMAGWSFGAASIYLIAASAFGCVALTSAWFIRSHRSKPTEGIEARLDRIPSPTESPQSQKSQRQNRADEATETAELDPNPATRRPIEVVIDRVQNLEDGGPTPPTLQQPIETTPSAFAGVEDQRPRSEHEEPPVRGSSIEAPNGDAAKRLAELLNRYERNGRPTGGLSDQWVASSLRTDHSSGERELWTRLVEEYGADSIDLRDDPAGTCRITLTSGDLVVYDPKRRTWMWVIFEQEEPIPLRDAESSSSDRVATDPS